MKSLRWGWISALILCLGSGRAFAISLVLDYSKDTFFNSHPVAKATLEAAAQAISSVIVTPLARTFDTSIGTVNNSFVTFNFDFNYTNPTTGADEVFDPAVVPANEVRVFVGMNPLTGSELGRGGPGGADYEGSGQNASPNDFVAAVNAAANSANANLGRGGGPIIGRFPQDSIGGVPFQLQYGAAIGNLWFNPNVDWQFDYTQPVGTHNDFYSVALHELLHAVGFGASTSWDNLVGASHSWNGNQVLSLLGTGNGVLSANDDHVAEGLLSTRLSDGAAQEAVMDPTITTGTRKTLTRLDLAFLRDIGWQTIAYPFLLGDFNFDNRRTAADIPAMLAALTDLNKFTADHSLQAADLVTIGDLNGDHLVSNADIQGLLDLVASDGGAGAISTVPEPASIALFCCGMVVLGCSSRRRTVRLPA